MIDWVSTAYAQSGAPAAAPAGAVWHQFVLLGLMVVIFYVLLIRPQQKRMKEHQALIDGLQREEDVVLQSGIHGRIKAMTEQVLTIEIADGVRVKVERQSVARKKNAEG